MSEYIAGWAHSVFGKSNEPDIESLIGTVALEAIADAGIDVPDIDAVFLGLFNNGFSAQDFPSSLISQVDARFRFKPAVRAENACATGTAAIHAALHFLAASKGRIALVVGAEKMTATPGPQVGEILLKACYQKEESGVQGGFAGVFALIAEKYYAKYGDQSLALAEIAAKNHRNGVGNPFAQIRKDLGVEFCNTVSDRNPIVAGPLRRTDCSPVSDGAAALVLCSEDVAATMKKAVRFRGTAHVNDFLPISRRDITAFEGASLAWRNALSQADLGLDDLAFVETHDCFTIAELLEYEAMGLTPPGCGARAIQEGWTTMTGKLPVNPSGGLKAKGHPIGATGVSMHALAAMQLSGLAPEGIAVPGATLGAVFNMGGAAVANYVSILESYR